MPNKKKDEQKKGKKEKKGEKKLVLGRTGPQLLTIRLTRTKGHVIKEAGARMETAAPPFTDSPERIIGTVYIGQVAGDRFTFGDKFANELRAIGAAHGFNVVTVSTKTDDHRWLRDSQLALDDGGVLIPWTASKYGDSSEWARPIPFAGVLMSQDSYFHQPMHPNHGQSLGGMFMSAARMDLVARLIKTAGAPAREGISYVEGGNLLVVQRGGGKVGAIVGEASLYQSMLVMEAIGALELAAKDTGRLNAAAARIEKLDDATYNRLRWMLAAANLASLRREEDEPMEDVSEFLLKLELAKELLAEDLGMPYADVTFVEQPGFHLDVAMAVGPGGTILLQDYGESEALLTELLDVHGLEPDTYHRLGEYLAAARVLSAGMKRSTDRIASQLAAAKYPVERLPGVFTTGVAATPHVANFFNHIGGTAPDGRMFYLTNGLSGQVGELLKGYFKAKLVRLGYAPELIFFLVNDGDAQVSLLKGGALRCLTMVCPEILRDDV